jgi:hypothetical protein
MLSPVLRTYFNPEEGDRVVTINFPHVMYYAPDVSSEDIGAGKLGGMYPFVILHGHHGYMIQPLGLTERAAINKEYEQMLARLCNSKTSGVCQKRKVNKMYLAGDLPAVIAAG